MMKTNIDPSVVGDAS